MMRQTMHAKSDSDATSVDALSPPRSPRRPLYYVQSPSNPDVEKMSYGSSPYGSPPHYHCSPIHHSRESSTSRFSASLKNVRGPGGAIAPWKRIDHRNNCDDDDDELDDDMEGEDGGADHGSPVRFYVICFVFSFVILFSIFSLILWAASVPYKPKIVVKSMVFENFNVQSGMDATGVPTDMLTLKSTVRIFYRNPATFFGVHVTATPLEIHYFQLKLASGHVKKFYESRKSQRMIVSQVLGYQVPLYGGVPVFSGFKGHLEGISVPLNLTFVVRSRAYILGKLVKPKFYKNVICEVTFRGSRLGKPINLTNSCVYHD